MMSKSLRPQSYHVQNGCWNCRHADVDFPYSALHCTKVVPLTAPEKFNTDEHRTWAIGTRVEPSGICAVHEVIVSVESEKEAVP